MKKIFFDLITLLLFINYGYSQKKISLPETSKSIEFNSDSGIISTSWDLENISQNSYFFNFYDSTNQKMVLQLEKTSDGIKLEPIEPIGKNILVEFWKNDSIIYNYYETTNKLKGPASNDYLSFKENLPKLNSSKTIIAGQKQIWPILVLMAVCCVQVEYYYVSGRPPKHKIKIAWNCNCLMRDPKSTLSLKFRVGDKIIEADYITYTIENAIENTNIKMIVGKKTKL